MISPEKTIFQKQEREKTKEEIIEENLLKMFGEKNGEMMHLLIRESIGGSAGYEEGHPCTAANFYYDKETGEIKIFSNYPLREPNVTDGTFRIIVDQSKINPFYKIINIYPGKESSPEANLVLEESVKTYNIETAILNASSISDLIENILPSIGEIKGSKGKVYKPEELKEIIKAVVEGKKDPAYLTRSYGLRNKVIEFLRKGKKE